MPGTSFRISLRNHYWDEIELDILDLIVSPLRAAIDVGANSGRYAFALSRFASHVYAIEPNPSMVKLLRAGLDVKRVTVLHRAASDDVGTAQLRIPTDAWGHGGENLASLERTFTGPTKTVAVATMTLDQLSNHDIGFIKLDIEGHELAALRGAVNILDRWKPTILIECDELSAGSMPPSFDFLISRGYEGYFIHSLKFHPLNELKPFMFDLSAFQPPRPRKFVPYTNNFLFFPSGGMTQVLSNAICERLRERYLTQSGKPPLSP
jgi:FkbM family methyltransferase